MYVCVSGSVCEVVVVVGSACGGGMCGGGVCGGGVCVVVVCVCGGGVCVHVCGVCVCWCVYVWW